MEELTEFEMDMRFRFCFCTVFVAVSLTAMPAVGQDPAARSNPFNTVEVIGGTAPDPDAKSKKNGSKSAPIESKKTNSRTIFISGEDCRQPVNTIAEKRLSKAAPKRLASIKVDPKIKAKFDPLVSAWEVYLAQPNIDLSSDSKTYTDDCPAYRSIVALGKPAIPCIMERYLKANFRGDNTGAWWTCALEDIISGIRRPQRSYDFDEDRRFWADWWSWQQGKRSSYPIVANYDPWIHDR